MDDKLFKVATQLAEAMTSPCDTWRIWYMLPSTDDRLARLRRESPTTDTAPLILRRTRLSYTHRCIALKQIPHSAEHMAIASSLYHYFQAENWSPSGEANPLITAMNLAHTSMCIGDIIENFDAKRAWMVNDFGFTEIMQ